MNSDTIVVYGMLPMPIPPGKNHLVGSPLGVIAGGALTLIDHCSCFLSHCQQTLRVSAVPSAKYPHLHGVSRDARHITNVREISRAIVLNGKTTLV
jgi:hypothetical protein